MTISFVIPVYNAEDTLDRCVGSVVSQGVSDMEIILVDDGSRDGSGTLCDVWAEKDSRIRVIHKENGGLSSARDAGVVSATGQYVGFIDSDDFLKEGCLAYLLNVLTGNRQIDILEFGVEHEDHRRLRAALPEKMYKSPRRYWLEEKVWEHSYVWNKIFRRTLFIDIRFPENALFEDLLIMPGLLKRSSVIVTSPFAGYVYTSNPRGISKQVDSGHIRALLKAEFLAAWRTRTFPWSRNGAGLYYYMMCRGYDLLRLLRNRNKEKEFQ